jgi:Na+/phosphate symporter
LDLEPETKRLVAEAKAANFGKPIKPVIVPKKTQREEYQEAKARLLETPLGKREEKLIDFHLQRAAELEKAGNITEATFYRQQAETVRTNGIAIREVFADNIAKHEKEIAENLAKPLEVIRAERKAAEAARVEKMREIMKKKRETMERNKQ